MDIEFAGEVIEWRGPAPFHFVAVAAELAEDLQELAREVTYGWGMIPVRATIGQTTFETSLWPKDGGFLLPIKDRVRRAEGVQLGDLVEVGMQVVTRDGQLVRDREPTAEQD